MNFDGRCHIKAKNRQRPLVGMTLLQNCKGQRFESQLSKHASDFFYRTQECILSIHCMVLTHICG